MRTYSRGRQQTNKNIIHRMSLVCWMKMSTNTHSEYLIKCFSVTTMTTQTHLKINLHVHYVSSCGPNRDLNQDSSTSCSR